MEIKQKDLSKSLILELQKYKHKIGNNIGESWQNEVLEFSVSIRKRNSGKYKIFGLLDEFMKAHKMMTYGGHLRFTKRRPNIEKYLCNIIANLK